MFFRARPPFFLLLFVLLLLLAVFVLLPVSILAAAFDKLGLTGVQGVLVFLATIVGSSVNLPLRRSTRLVRGDPAPASRLFRFGSMRRMILHPGDQGELLLSEQVIAVNVGGCIVPCLLSAWFMAQMYAAGELGGWLALCIVVCSLACYLLARPMPGVGIGVPVLLPPAVAAIAAMLLAPPGLGPRAAYMAGTLGTLLGADVLHLLNRRTTALLDAPLLSIGGAGTFDGIFLSGILAVLLA